MLPGMRVASFLSCVSLGFVAFACGGDDGLAESTSGAQSGDPPGAAPGTPSAPNTAEGGGTADDPGPKPTRTCATTPDRRGFFQLKSPKAAYWVHLPAGYDGTAPVRAVLGLHGCGDSAESFLEWGVSPPTGRDRQGWIAISPDGASKGGNCWDAVKDVDVALAALDDAAACFWVDRRKVTVAGYSSGGILAYTLALKHADRFAGVLVENSGAYGVQGFDDALAGAAWKLPVAHHARTGDEAFPIARVRASWEKLRGAGFPLETKEAAGDHNGEAAVWETFLHPKAEAWRRPAGR